MSLKRLAAVTGIEWFLAVFCQAVAGAAFPDLWSAVVLLVVIAVANVYILGGVSVTTARRN